MSGPETESPTCVCGNPANAICVSCGSGVCRLCIRTDEAGEVCLACRARALERAWSGKNNAGKRTPFVPGVRVRKHLILMPAVILGAIAVMTLVAVPILADARGARAERQAEQALRAIWDAQQTFKRGSGKSYASLAELRNAGLLELPMTPGYVVKIELAKDGHAFWARAIPVTDRLRGICIDARGEPRYE